jgi:hypothetical protein
MKAFPAVLALAVIVAACGGDTPSMPPFDYEPLPLPPPSEGWALQATIESMSGHEACSWVTRAGESAHWRLLVTRTPGRVDFMYGPTHDEWFYSGPLFDGQFTVTGPTVRTRLPCGSALVDFTFDGTVRGRFSSDGRTLTATETWFYRPASGGTIEIQMSWVAAAH